VTQIPSPPSYWDAMLSSLGLWSRNITSCGSCLMMRQFNHGWCTVQQLWQWNSCSEALHTPWGLFLVHEQAVIHTLVAKSPECELTVVFKEKLSMLGWWRLESSSPMASQPCWNTQSTRMMTLWQRMELTNHNQSQHTTSTHTKVKNSIQVH
jgi:hypothetical protein